MTSKYMTYLYKYYVPGTTTVPVTITMQCTNTLPRSNEKLQQRTSTNDWTTMTMPILTSMPKVL